MKKRKNITAKLCLLLLFFAAVAMIVLPLQAWAAGDDSDSDGILNEEEVQCLPFDAPTGLCEHGDPGRPDLFILLLRADQSLLPDNPFEFITDRPHPFDINLHVISEADAPDQMISSTQYAVALIEDQRTSDGDLGTSHIGTPASRVSGRVYPNRIFDDVVNACSQQNPDSCDCVNSEGTPCLNPDGSMVQGIDQIANFYEKNVLAHETFHMLDRVLPPDRKLDYHYAQLGYIMDHHMVYKVSKKDKKVTWYITDKWADADKPLFK